MFLHYIHLFQINRTRKLVCIPGGGIDVPGVNAHVPVSEFRVSGGDTLYPVGSPDFLSSAQY
jgi:hypothetical protein